MTTPITPNSIDAMVEEATARVLDVIETAYKRESSAMNRGFAALWIKLIWGASYVGSGKEFGPLVRFSSSISNPRTIIVKEGFRVGNGFVNTPTADSSAVDGIPKSMELLITDWKAKLAASLEISPELLDVSIDASYGLAKSTIGFNFGRTPFAYPHLFKSSLNG